MKEAAALISCSEPSTEMLDDLQISNECIFWLNYVSDWITDWLYMLSGTGIATSTKHVAVHMPTNIKTIPESVLW